jgi:hypothetical protein
MGKLFSEMGAIELWTAAQRCLREGKLRDAKEALDELGLRFDDAYESLESAMLKAGAECDEGVVFN